MRAWRSILKNHIVPSFGSLGAETLSRSQVKCVLAEIAAAHPATSNRVLELLRVAYRWAMDEDPPLVEGSPCPGLQKLPEKPRERILSSDEIAAVWLASERESVAGAAIRFLLLSGQRLSEVLGMRMAELDLDGKVWRIPSDRMKSGRPHSVPLSSGLLEIIRSRAPFADYVFASGRRSGEPLATLQHSHAAIQQATGIRFQIRDLRRTARSGFSALGVAPEVAERILAHAVPRIIATYDKHVPLVPMRSALEQWCQEVTRMVAARVARTSKGAWKARARGKARPDDLEPATV